MSHREKITFLADSYWLGMALFVLLSLFSVYVVLVSWTWHDYYYQVPLKDGGYTDLQDVIYCCLFFGILYIALAITLLVASRRCVVFVTLTKDGIAFSSPFRPKKVKPYTAFPDLYRGCYTAYGIERHEFIVLTNRRMRYEELQRVNMVFNDENTIKIRYTKRNYAALKEMLPRRQRSALIRSFGTDEEKAALIPKRKL